MEESTAIGPKGPNGAAFSGRSIFHCTRSPAFSEGADPIVSIAIGNEVQSSVGGGETSALVEGLLMGQPSALSVQAVDTNGLRTLHGGVSTWTGLPPSGSETPTESARLENHCLLAWTPASDPSGVTYSLAEWNTSHGQPGANGFVLTSGPPHPTPSGSKHRTRGTHTQRTRGGIQTVDTTPDLSGKRRGGGLGTRRRSSIPWRRQPTTLVWLSIESSTGIPWCRLWTGSRIPTLRGRIWKAHTHHPRFG